MSDHTIIRYRVHPERAAENEELVRGVYAELDEVRPEGLRYATFKQDDGVTFVHLVRRDGSAALPELPAFQRFQEGLRDRCAQPPARTEVELIGAHGWDVAALRAQALG